MRLVILGSGTSFGVPVIGCDCAVCRSDDPKDRRTRVAALVETGDGQRLLIDTPPELRLQLLAAGADRVDAVLYTHDHADHVHGIDDLRAISVTHGPLSLFGPAATLETLRRRFTYIFDDGVVPPPGTSKPRLVLTPLAPGGEVEIAGVTVLPLVADHGGTPVFGYRIGAMAYFTDVKRLDDDVLARIAGVDVLVLSALFERPHATHLSIPEAVEIARRVGARQTFLTHLTHRYGHAALAARLPEGVAPAHDGLAVTF